ncbi:TIGR03087 family PEP-CTERM/XrtA system glycosyltransferase [Dechloromonas denitrificans]|uniref:TIGR03087 family PEP-CTERM/XrtA system glycosyltransferase n=1 Tax=Dechloromonas denitrificans TaxID=281362 RepID=UPI001CF88115|nr:TIGR03087 family PEP-CTERM/XrtA system glycosyltransferase [Dechloromonas denitrificans]UCV01926.1 TIGR03087 family PEP-CTERM/XrtA system glycosyltransferase [Dechloromonas denitrificans]UCV06260.1 TIGR03087 family PEP-CTERM/XrtA system glycosyltransferase [Dechloromonas denitrificans]
MANILYLVHRLPYPPNKGDKVRSYNLLKHLLKQHRVFLGTFIDDPDDEQHIATLRGMCADLHVARLDPRFAKIRSLNGLLAGEPLTLRYYRDAALQNWVDATCHAEKIDAAVIFSSAMAQYVEDKRRMPVLIDFVDVDSAKWTQYAPKHRWPMSWLYRREGKILLAYEREMAHLSTRSFFVTEAEAELFTKQAPECGVRVEAMCNGVDADYFCPDPERPSPYASDESPVVFTGAMDYWPNVDAVTWFASKVLPGLRRYRPKIRFYIVGRSPTPEVQALAGDDVIVTGTVPDVRPYLQHAGVVVAPLRIARGIQNKILEAMAMERPVIATADCAAAVDANKTTELLTATSASEFIETITGQLDDPESAALIGRAARARVIARYSWEAHMSGIDPYISSPVMGGGT